jgi:hypothetical protein
MKRLTSRHAEDVGGFVVEPGHEFDENTANPDVIRRLTDEGKVADAKAAKKTPTKKDADS